MNALRNAMRIEKFYLAMDTSETWQKQKTPYSDTLNNRIMRVNDILMKKYGYANWRLARRRAYLALTNQSLNIEIELKLRKLWSQQQ